MLWTPFAFLTALWERGKQRGEEEGEAEKVERKRREGVERE